MSTYDNSTSFGQYLNNNATAGSAYDYLTALFKQYNIDMSAPIKDIMVNGITNQDAIMQRLEATPQFKQRFPAIAERQAKGLSAISPGDYVNMERGYQQALTSVGIDPSYLSSDDMTQMIAHDKSASELQSQLHNTYSTIVNGPPETQAQLQRLYGMGVTPGEAAAFFLDPDKTEAYLTKRVNAAQMATSAQQSGFGQLNVNQAENLAGLGVTQSQANQGFGQLALQNPLLEGNASENGAISTDTALGATFENNAADQTQINRRLEGRQGDFKGGGTYQQTKGGLTGAGTSNG